MYIYVRMKTSERCRTT